MIYNDLDTLISEAVKSHDNASINCLRMIKSTLVKAEKDGIELNDVTEGKILQKMVKQSEDAISQFKAANRMDLAEKEEAELTVLKKFAPKEASEEDIINATKEVCSQLEKNGTIINMSVMRDVMSKVQAIIPNASGKIISNVVKSWK